MYKKLLTILIAGVLLVSLLVPAASALEIPEIAAEAYILADMDSGNILCEKNMTVRRSPASLTKIMTGLLAVEAVERGDIGLAWPQAVPVVKACVDSALQLGLPEARLPLAEACIFLATCPKSNTACLAIDAALSDVRAGKIGNIPRELQNVHADGTGFEREQGYKYPHDYPNRWVDQQYLPDELKDARYYRFGDNKTEQAARAYW